MKNGFLKDCLNFQMGYVTHLAAFLSENLKTNNQKKSNWQVVLSSCSYKKCFLCFVETKRCLITSYDDFDWSVCRKVLMGRNKDGRTVAIGI